MCDLISDAILDEILSEDPMARVARETCTTTGLVMVMGEITAKANIDIPQIVRNTIREIGYTNSEYGSDADGCNVLSCIDKQSSDIALGVNMSLEGKEKVLEVGGTGAGD